MNLKTTLLLLVCLLTGALFAATPDSLRRELTVHADEPLKRAQLLLELGQFFSKQLERDSAIRYYRESLVLARKLDQKTIQLECLEDLARNILNRRLQLDSVDIHVREGLELAEQLPGRTIAKANLLRIWGEYYRQKGEMEKGIEPLETASDLLKEGLDGKLSEEDRRLYTDRYILVLNARGNILKNLSRCEEAIQVQQRIIELCRQTENHTQEAYATFNMGSCYFIQGDYPRALEYYLKSPEIMRDSVKKAGMSAGVNLGVGGIYAEMGQIDSARVYYKKALKNARDIQRARTEIGTLENLGVLELKAERYDSSIYYFEQGIALARAGDRRALLAASLAQIGAAHLYAGHDGEAARYLNEAYTLSRELDSPTEIAYSEATLAEYHYRKGQFRQAVQLATAALSAAEARQMMDIQRRTTLTLSQAYEGLGNSGKALELYKKHIALRDQLLNEDKVREITQLKMQNQFEQERERQRLEQEKKDALVTAQLQRQNIQRRAMGGGLLAMGALATALFWGYRNKQKSHALLEDKNQLIQESLKEKEVLLKEIHHRVKNNLQVISSLLSLQSRRVEDESIQEAILEGRNRVRSMAMIHQNLYQTEQLSTINVSEYVDHLTQNLFSSYNIEPERIKMETKIQPLELDVDILIPLGLILNELITNALKYAFPDEKTGTIHVGLYREEGPLVLRVTDNGIGMPKQFDFHRARSMGYQLINSFVKKLKGDLKIQSFAGTDVVLSIPQPESI